LRKILVKQVGSGKSWKNPKVFREDKDGVAIVKIRRPKVLNALNGDVFDQLGETFSKIQKDPRSGERC